MRRNRPAIFKGHEYEAEIIVACVRWYLRRAIGQRVWEIGIEQIIKLDRTPKNGPGDEPGPQ